MEQQNKLNEGSNKFLEKTPPKKLKKILRVLSIIYGAIFLFTAYNEWFRGDHEGAKATARGTIIMMAILIILSFKINKEE